MSFLAGFGALLIGCSGQKHFEMADSNGDGKVSRSEFKRYMLETVYSDHDHNEDYKVTLAEWKRNNRFDDESKFHAGDRNRDGVVTPYELKRHYSKYGTLDDLFCKIDADGNGYLTHEEVKAFRSKYR